VSGKVQKKTKNTEPIELDRFGQLLRQGLEQGASHKSALDALREEITAYPDRKMEVKFEICLFFAVTEKVRN